MAASKLAYALALHYKAAASQFRGASLSKENSKRALKWAFKAASSRRPAALKLLASFYETGVGTPICKKIAFECYLLCESDAEAMYKLAACHEKGVGVSLSIDKAIDVLRKSASMCDHEGLDPTCPRAKAQYRLAKLLQNTAPRYELPGLTTFNACYDTHGHIGAWIWIAENHSYQTHRELQEQAVRLLETSQGRDRLKLTRYLGSMHCLAWDSDLFEYLVEGAIEGDIECQERLGRYLCWNSDGASDLSEGIMWLKRAIQNRIKRCHLKHPDSAICTRHLDYEGMRCISVSYRRIDKLMPSLCNDISQALWNMWQAQGVESARPTRWKNGPANIIFYGKRGSKDDRNRATQWMEQQTAEDVEMWMSVRGVHREAVSVIKKSLPQPIAEEILDNFFSIPVEKRADKRPCTGAQPAKRTRKIE